MLDTVESLLQRFEISHYGFLPIDEPLSCLPDAYYKPWEDIISQLPLLIANRTIYDKLNQLPILSTDKLSSPPEWRRAYVILTFFTHANIWSDSTPHEVGKIRMTVASG